MKIKYKFKSTFGKNVLKITGGTAFAQIISIVLYPVITRLYSPEEYGVISIYTAILLGISFLGSMNYEMGIPIAENEEKAINILSLSISTLFFFTSITALIFLCVGDVFLNLLNSESLIDYKLLIPLGVLLLGLYNIFTQWAFRKKNFNAITKTKVSQSIFQNLISILGGVFGSGPIGLILGRVFGQSAGIFTLSNPLIKYDRYLLKKISWKEILWSAKRYKNFPFYTMPRRFLGDITVSLPILFLTSIYGSHAVGLFGLANSIIQLPVNLIGNSIGNVFYAESASLRNKDPQRVRDLSNKLLKTLILIGIFPLIGLILFGPAMFTFAFGNEWSEAGEYARLLSISIFLRLIVTPISSVFDVYEKQKVALLLNILKLSLVITVFIIANFFTLNSYWTVGLYSIVMSVIYITQYLLAQKILNDAITKNNS